MKYDVKRQTSWTFDDVESSAFFSLMAVIQNDYRADRYKLNDAQELFVDNVLEAFAEMSQVQP